MLCTDAGNDQCAGRSASRELFAVAGHFPDVIFAVLYADEISLGLRLAIRYFDLDHQDIIVRIRYIMACSGIILPGDGKIQRGIQTLLEVIVGENRFLLYDDGFNREKIEIIGKLIRVNGILYQIIDFCFV